MGMDRIGTPSVDEHMVLAGTGPGDQQVARGGLTLYRPESVERQERKRVAVGETTPRAGGDGWCGEPCAIKRRENQPQAIQASRRVPPTRAKRHADEVFCRLCQLPAGRHAAPVG